MTAFDNIKTNNWPAASNEFEDFLVLKLPLNEQASLTESLPVNAGSQELFPKRTLTNFGGVSMQYARVQPDYGATGFTKSTNWRETTHAAPEIGLFNGDGTSTQPAVNGDNAEHWFAFATPLTNVTKVETRMGHDGYQSARAYMGNGTTNYISTSAHAAYFTVYSGVATTFSKMGWRSNNGSGASVYDIRITDNTGTYVLTSNQNEKKHYDNNASFSSSKLIVPQHKNFQFGDENFTIEAYINPDNVSGTKAIVSTWNPGSNRRSYVLQLSNASVLAATHPDGGNTSHPSMTGGTVTANAWSHVAFVRDGATLRLFVNGTQVATTTAGTVYSNTTDNLEIGAYPGSAANYFAGKIQDVRIYKGAAKYTSNFTPPSAILS